MKYLLSVLIGITYFQGFSQNYVDIVNLTYTNTPANDFEAADASTTVEELRFEFNFPVVINKSTTFLSGLYTDKTKLHLDPLLPSTNLNVVGLKFGVHKILNDTWATTLMVFPKLASDKIEFSNDNFQFAFLSLFTQKKHSNLKYKYGVYANTEKYGLIIVPIIGLYYVSPNKKFESNLNLPIRADINYKLNNKLWLGMKFDGLGTTYNLNEQNYGVQNAYVSKTSNELVSYLKFKLSKSIYLNTKIGYAISRNYKVYDQNDKIDLAISSFYFGDNRTQLNDRFKDGAIFKVELFYRLNFD